MQLSNGSHADRQVANSITTADRTIVFVLVTVGHDQIVDCRGIVLVEHAAFIGSTRIYHDFQERFAAADVFSNPKNLRNCGLAFTDSADGFRPAVFHLLA